MPTKPKYAAASYRTMPDVVSTMNLIRANASSEYQERIPVATQENIEAVGNPLLTYQAQMNEFLSSLVNRIAFVMISSELYNNPLREFKRGVISTGETVEEIFVNLIKAEPYYLEAFKVNPEIGDGMTDWEDALKRRLPDVKAVFHTRNRQDKYPVTISHDDLRTAFLSWNGVSDLVARIVETLTTSDNYDEFILMKNLFVEAAKRGGLKAIVTTPVTDKNSADDFLATARTAALSLNFLNPAYNQMGVPTSTPLERLVFFITPQVSGQVTVKSLAAAFNIDEAKLIGRVVLVDDFGGLEQEGVIAVAVDERWFMVFDNLLTMTEMYNPARLYWNYFLHHWQTLSYSPFRNAIAFVTEAPTVTAVTVTPTAANVNAGAKTKLTAEVEGTGLYSPRVTWTSNNAAVTVDVDGNVTVSKTATGTAVITATSVTDTGVTGTATLTIQGN